LEYLSPPVCEVILSGSGFPSIDLEAYGVIPAPGPIQPPDFPESPFFGLPDTVPGVLCVNIAERNGDGVFVIITVCLPPVYCELPKKTICVPVPKTGCFKFQYITENGTSLWSEEVCVIIPEVDTNPATDIT
jgi:hypothetical protein